MARQGQAKLKKRVRENLTQCTMDEKFKKLSGCLNKKSNRVKFDKIAPELGPVYDCIKRLLIRQPKVQF